MAFLAMMFVLVALGTVGNAECDIKIPRSAASIGKWDKLPELSSLSSDVTSRGRVLPALLKRADGVREEGEARVPIPGPIPLDTEQLKKIAEILSVIGQQVLPALLGQTNGGK